MMKSVSIHTEMVFSRIMHGIEPERQGRILEMVADSALGERLRPIAITKLTGLTASSMRAAHGLVETRRTIGKIVLEV